MKTLTLFLNITAYIFALQTITAMTTMPDMSVFLRQHELNEIKLETHDTNAGASFTVAEIKDRNSLIHKALNAYNALQKSTYGKPALVHVPSFNMYGLAEAYLVLGANCNKQANDRMGYGATPLVAAALWNSLHSLILLCAYKADINKTSKQGYTPLQSAQFKRNKSLETFILWWQNLSAEETATHGQLFKTNRDARFALVNALKEDNNLDITNFLESYLTQDSAHAASSATPHDFGQPSATASTGPLAIDRPTQTRKTPVSILSHTPYAAPSFAASKETEETEETEETVVTHEETTEQPLPTGFYTTNLEMYPTPESALLANAIGFRNLTFSADEITELSDAYNLCYHLQYPLFNRSYISYNVGQLLNRELQIYYALVSYDENQRKRHHRTGLLTAIYRGYTTILRALIIIGYNIHEYNIVRKITKYITHSPLVEAVQHNKIDTALLLLCLGCNPATHDNLVSSPPRENNLLYFFANRHQNTEMLAILNFWKDLYNNPDQTAEEVSRVKQSVLLEETSKWFQQMGD